MQNENSNRMLEGFYVAVILMESYSDDPRYKSLFEESFVLFKASSHDDASLKAYEYGLNQGSTYENEANISITWKLNKVIDVNPVLNESLEQGTELYSRHFRDIDAYDKLEVLYK